MDELDKAAVSYQAVLTKCDAMEADETADAARALTRALARRPAALPMVLETSARTGAGIAALRAHLARLAGVETIR